MKKKLNFLNYLFYLIALFIILPNNIKEVPFILLGLFTIVVFVMEKKIEIKKFLLISIFFIINIISLFYTKDLHYGINRIGGILPFLYVPFSYCIILKMDLRFDRKFVDNWILVFNTSICIFLIIFCLFFYFQDLPLTYNNVRTILDKIPLINMHPIYLSIVAVLGMMSCAYIIKNNLKKGLFLICVNVVLLILSGARATFVGFLAILFFMIFFSKLDLKAKYVLFFISIISIYSIFSMNTDFKKRFREIIIPISYSKVDINNSTSVRFAIWDCDIEQIKKSNFLFGYGLGDVPSKLQECYDDKYPELGKYYNSHNQYFSIVLGTGLIGLISFLIFFLYFFSDAIKNKNYFLVVLILFYLYMFNFENIIERKYGVLLLLFFMLYVFNIFTKISKDDC